MFTMADLNAKINNGEVRELAGGGEEVDFVADAAVKTTYRQSRAMKSQPCTGNYTHKTPEGKEVRFVVLSEKPLNEANFKATILPPQDNARTGELSGMLLVNNG